MLPLETIIYLGLVAYRVSRFLVTERGPLRVMERVREWVDPHSEYEVFHCIFCMSVWTSMLVYAVHLLNLDALMAPLAVMGVVALIGDLRR